VFVFKVGSNANVNSFGLGDSGRYRTNFWNYAGATAVGSTRTEELEMHPTMKPVALVADAIRDCSRRGDIMLDMFGGSTLIAAEMCSRTARLIEYDPAYWDAIIMRQQKYTGHSYESKPDSCSFEVVDL
jgi:DNA modification methylase